MEAWLHTIHEREVPPGLELRLLRKMPGLLLLGTALPLALSVIARWTLASDAIRQITAIDIFAITSVITVWTAAFTVTIGCVIVHIMKGPAYVADAYALNDAPRPRP